MLILSILLCLFALVVGSRAYVAFLSVKRMRHLEQTRIAGDLSHICVVQPILGGDPTLSAKLAANCSLYPDVSFLWLIDEDDDLGMNAAQAALRSTEASRVEVLRVPRAPNDENPKVFKLDRAYSSFKEVFVILDDDCLLQTGSLEGIAAGLTYADLATGIPFYREGDGFWSKLLASFPNGQSVLTYFPTTMFAQARTINGMFYATTKTALNRTGGFAGIRPYLCDDYELAKRFSLNGLSICQTTAPVNIFTSLPNGKAYLQLMHRWAFFSVRQLTELVSPQAIWFVVLPTLLPLVCLLVALFVEPVLVLLVFLISFMKTELTFHIRRKFFGIENRGRIDLEVLTDFLIPMFFAVAMFSRRIRWRDKVFASNGKALVWRN